MNKRSSRRKPKEKAKPRAGSRPLRRESEAKRSNGDRGTKSQPEPARQPEGGEQIAPAAARAIEVGRAASFPVVGIGASAGGLEALEEFLMHVAPHSGMAYVVIQHLDPAHKGAMVELLQRACPTMPVVEAKDRQEVEVDHVYVIPPNKDMSIMHGVLHLLPQTSPRGLNLPIDFFFRSLAEDQQERSIGVVLSGMGSDGTLGLRAIKEKAGAGFVQSLESAKFASMPRSVIDAGLADVIARADELPARITAFVRHAPYVAQPSPIEEKPQSGLEKVFVLLRAHTGNDFSLYKRSTIYRRIERRMGLHQIDKMANYVRYLRENPREIELLFKELLIGVTSFFRDPPAWEHLQRHILPELLDARVQSGVVRAWVPGCSTGEEAYSLAIALTETLERSKHPGTVQFQIFATDLDRDAIEKARQGIFPANIAADVSAERLRRFFHQDERGYRVRKEVRETVVFAPQNIIMDPPFTKLDIVSCRNLLIYLSPELQKKIIPLFHYALNPGGILFLGSAETIGAFSALFEPADGKTRVYRRLESAIAPPAVEFPPAFAMPTAAAAGAPQPAEPVDFAKTPPPNLTLLAERVIVTRFAPTAVLTNEKGDILYTSGRTGKYLEPSVGKANFNVFAMAREGLRYELSSAFSTALRGDRPVSVGPLRVGTNGGTQYLELTVQKLTEPRELRGTLMIVIADVPAPHDEALGKARRTSTSARVVELERELQHAREEVQTTREEMQTSQEELKSTNEELQSTNEELQSTNEELTTSKEEMQSMNEELQTVNHELTAKVDELSRSNNDMKNLLNSTDIATLFLDGELLVRRFTTQTSKLIKLIPADAGRPITDIATELDYPDLADDARDVLRTLVFKEKQVASRDGRWFAVRILPYRTLDNVIDGVVITFTEATTTKRLETALREQANQLKQMTESLPTLVWACRPDGACEYLSQQWLEYVGIPEGEQLGYGWLERVHPDERERVREQWREAVRAGQPLNTKFRIRAGEGGYRWFTVRSVPILDEQQKIVRWYATATDVDDLKQAVERLGSVLEGVDEAFVDVDETLSITHLNSAAEQLLDRKRDQILGKNLLDILQRDVSVLLDEKLHQAVQQKHALSFEAQVGEAPRRVQYTVRVYPHNAGSSVFFRQVDGTGSPVQDGS